MGIAVADDATGVVVPLVVVAYEGAARAAQTVIELAARHGAEIVVIGLPTSTDGERTAACVRSEKLSHEIDMLGIVTYLQPEVLSTHEARRRARDAGLAANRPVDHLAAQVILEEFLAGRCG